MSERGFRIGGAVVFLLVAVVVAVPLFDGRPLTTLDHTARIIGAVVLVVLAAVSLVRPGRGRGRK